MKTVSYIFAALAVFGVSAKPIISSGCQPNNYDNMNGGYSSTMPIINTQVRTPVVENPTVQFPSFVLPTTISDTCHCLKTLIRPQIRNELISVPTIDRIVRTVPTPVVETVNYSGGRRFEVPAYSNQINNFMEENGREKTPSADFQGNNISFNGATQGNTNGATQTSFSICPSTSNNHLSGVNFSGYNGGTSNSENRGSVGAFQNPNAEIFPISNSGVFSVSNSGNSVFSNGARIRGY